MVQPRTKLLLAATLLLGAVSVVVLCLAKKDESGGQNINNIKNYTQDELSHSKMYENSTVGIAFEYPGDWEIHDDEFELGQGDIMKNGKIYTTFSIRISPPNWDGSRGPSFVDVGHYPYISADGKSFDYLPIDEQLALVDCASKHKYGGYDSEYICEMRKSSKGVVYAWEKGYVNQVGKGYGARGMVPTGKYILTFSILSENKENYPQDVENLENILSSIELR